MIFGERYYKLLGEMSPWRQSLFALVLAQRQLPNYALWCDVENIQGGVRAFELALKQLWEFHRDKNNHIDLEKVINEVEPFMLKDDKEDLLLGDLFGLDACLSLSAAADAVILHDGDEAEIASRASLGGVIRKIEQQEPDLSDEELRNNPAVDNEVNFQIEMMELLKKSKRSADLTGKLLDMAYREGSSNIGISLEGFAKQDYSA